MSTEKPGYKPAKSMKLGQIIDELGRRYEKRRKADAIAAVAKAEEEAVRDYLLEHIDTEHLNGARGDTASIAIIETDVPTIGDWDKFFAYAKRKGNEDLFQRSVSSPAWRERINQKVAVPGVETFHRTSLRLNMIKKGK